MIIIKYAKLCFDDTVNGNGFRTSIFVSGCSKTPKCKNCWNQAMWSHDYGYEYTLETELKILNSLAKPWVKGLSILGGEPMDNLKDETLLNLVKKCKELYPNKTVYCWTGYKFEDLIKDELRLEFIRQIDMLRDGEYIEELKDLSQYLQGSKNQRYIDCQQSLKVGQIFVNKVGEEAEIIDYKNSREVTIRFLKNDEIKVCQFGHLLRGAFMSNKTTSRIGEVHKLNCGWQSKIIDYKTSIDVTIKILETGEIMNVRYDHLKEGGVTPKTFPTVHNIGYLGEECKTTINEDGSVKKSYKTWSHMMDRGYSEVLKSKFPSYEGVSVCEEWHNYSTFEKWFDDNYYEIDGQTMHLDKDIVKKGNKIYSPETCVFVPVSINSIFTKRERERGKYPIGVSKSSYGNKFEVNGAEYGENRPYLGKFNTPEEAFYVYKQAKEKHIKRVADEYKDKIPQKLYEAMYRYEVEITD